MLRQTVAVLAGVRFQSCIRHSMAALLTRGGRPFECLVAIDGLPMRCTRLHSSEKTYVSHGELFTQVTFAQTVEDILVLMFSFSVMMVVPPLRPRLVCRREIF